MKIGLICSHGGHLTEMEELAPAFEGCDVFWVTYRNPRLEDDRFDYLLENFGRNPLRYVAGLGAAHRILRRERPDLLVSTGSEIALPFFVVARFLGIRTIFVESLCRVETPSGTGRILYPLADEFYVQWPSMVERYGAKAKYAGGLL